MPDKVILNPPPNISTTEGESSWKTWFNSVHARVGEGPLLIQGYGQAGVPSVDDWGSLDTSDPFSSIIFVIDAFDGDVGTQPTIAFSNGTEWISLLTGVSIITP